MIRDDLVTIVQRDKTERDGQQIEGVLTDQIFFFGLNIPLSSACGKPLPYLDATNSFEIIISFIIVGLDIFNKHLSSGLEVTLNHLLVDSLKLAHLLPLLLGFL